MQALLFPELAQHVHLAISHLLGLKYVLLFQRALREQELITLKVSKLAQQRLIVTGANPHALRVLTAFSAPQGLRRLLHGTTVVLGEAPALEENLPLVLLDLTV
jgi:hypothetical protein